MKSKLRLCFDRDGRVFSGAGFVKTRYIALHRVSAVESPGNNIYKQKACRIYSISYFRFHCIIYYYLLKSYILGLFFLIGKGVQKACLEIMSWIYIKYISSTTT